MVSREKIFQILLCRFDSNVDSEKVIKEETTLSSMGFDQENEKRALRKPFNKIVEIYDGQSNISGQDTIQLETFGDCVDLIYSKIDTE